MRPIVIIGLGALGLGVIAVLSSNGAKSTSTPKNPIEAIQGMPIGQASSVQGYYSSIKGLQGWGQDVHTPPSALTKMVWGAQNAEFERRKKQVWTYLSTLSVEQAKDAYGGASPDSHSKQNFLIYRPAHFQTGAFGPEQWGWYLTDEYGRPYEGWGYGGSPFGAALQLAQAALPLVPGIGTAAAFGLGAVIAVGQGKSLKDAALAGARASLPPYAQIAFDIGVGVANGQSIGDAALESSINALEEKYPGSRDAYNQARVLAHA